MSDPEEVNVDELLALDSAASPGPWRWNVNPESRQVYLECAGRGRGHLYVMDFVRWGMGGAAPRFRDAKDLMVRVDELTATVPGREHHQRWFRTLKHPDAELLVASRNAAPTLARKVKALEAKIEEQRDRISEAWDVLDDVGRVNPSLPIACAQAMQERATFRRQVIEAEAEIKRLRNSLRRMLGVYEALMPGLNHIAVQNYLEINEAPCEARSLLGGIPVVADSAVKNMTLVDTDTGKVLARSVLDEAQKEAPRG